MKRSARVPVGICLSSLALAIFIGWVMGGWIAGILSYIVIGMLLTGFAFMAKG